MAHLRAIAERADLPGVTRGRLSVDWLCGLSDEPSRDARAEVGQLPTVLANHVANQVARRLPRTGFWQSFVTYWRTDGPAIIERAITCEVECFRRASDGLEDLAAAERAIIEHRIGRDVPLPWPERGTSREQRKELARGDAQRRRGLVGNLVYALMYAEFTRRINASGAALIYKPAPREQQSEAVKDSLSTTWGKP